MEFEEATGSRTASPASTPLGWMSPLSRELKEVIAERNLLTCRTRKRVMADMEEAATAQEEQQMDKLRRKAIAEVISSEKSYLRHLEIVQEFFMRPLEEDEAAVAKNGGNPLLPRPDFIKVFGDLPSILQVNRELLKCLEESEDRIGKVFTQLAPYLKFYSTYANDFRNAVKIVDKQMSRSKEFRTLVNNQENRPEVQLKLNSLLITPVQRIPRYKLLLEDVIGKTPRSHPDKASLDSALEQIEAVAWHINEQLREHENSLRMLDIQRSLVGGQPKVIAPGRKLLKQGLLMKVPRSGGGGVVGGVGVGGGYGGATGQPRYFVLFSDMIMYCKIKSSSSSSSSAAAKMQPPVLPKAGLLDCGCAMPLKLTAVETVVGRGVFKLKCQKEELLLYSREGASASQQWVEAILEAKEKAKANAATLRKESSKRTPLKRPDLMRMRRESLGQIMMVRLTKEKAKKLLLTPSSSTSSAKSGKKHDDPPSTNSGGASPLLRKRKCVGENHPSKGGSEASAATPKRARRTSRLATPGGGGGDGGGAPPPARTPQVAAQRKAKNGGGGAGGLRWQTLTRNNRWRKNGDKGGDSERGKVSLFRSPSIFDEAGNNGGSCSGQGDEEEEDEVMAKYLAGQLVPLTPSQAPTNVSHLATKKQPSSNQGQPANSFTVASPTSDNPSGGEQARPVATEATAVAAAPSSNSYCVVM